MNRPTVLSRAIAIALVAGLAATTLAQNNVTESARYLVAYVSVGPSSGSTFRGAFDQYREASRGELGFIGYEAFEQLGRPGEFVVSETWRDQAAADAHVTAASRKRFLGALDSMRGCSRSSAVHWTSA